VISKDTQLINSSKAFRSLLFIDYHLFVDRIESIPEQKKVVINTINTHSFYLAEKDSHFKDSLRRSDVLLPDGIGIVLASRILYGKRIRKIAGIDLFHFLLSRYGSSEDVKKRKVFFLGSSEETLTQIKEKMRTTYPEIIVHTYSPPFKDFFSEQENNDMVKTINSFKPYVLFVGMTAPKQEKWVHDHMEKLDVPYICSVGAVFDFFAGTVKRPGKFWVSHGLEWFVRFVREPRRLWRRVLISPPVFIITILGYKYLRRYFKPSN
jgi:N-acetylglucosaminyldiphosphoundecaprenol N-acetyl-beta-D-mannosaminyltransferase